MENNENPLFQYFRDVAIYIKLPSNGFYSKPGDIEASANGEIAIYPMTTADELLFQSPDALLNGESVLQVIKSCAPGIKNVRDLPMNDVESILLGIKYSTYGDQVDYESTCPMCSHAKEFGVSIEACLQNTGSLEPDEKVFIEKDDLMIKIKPYTFSSSVKAAILAFNEGKFLQMLTEEDLAEEEKAMKATESFKKATALTMDLLTDSIISVSKKDGDLITDDPVFIKQWLSNIGKKEANKIEEGIKRINDVGINKNIDLTCDECDHKWTTKIEFDPSNFFE